MGAPTFLQVLKVLPGNIYIGATCSRHTASAAANCSPVSRNSIAIILLLKDAQMFLTNQQLMASPTTKQGNFDPGGSKKA